MANEHNLIPGAHKLTVEEQSRGGVKSGEKRRALRSMRDGVEALLDDKAPDSVVRSFRKIGYDIETNYEAAVTSIVAGALKGKPELVRVMLDLLDESPKAKRDAELFEYKKRKEEAETARAEMETELYKMRIDAIKGIGQEEQPDDGFLDALKSNAAEDWSNDIL